MQVGEGGLAWAFLCDEQGSGKRQDQAGLPILRRMEVRMGGTVPLKPGHFLYFGPFHSVLFSLRIQGRRHLFAIRRHRASVWGEGEDPDIVFFNNSHGSIVGILLTAS